MIGTDEISGPGDGEHGVSVAPMPGDPQKPIQEPPPAPPAEDPSAKVYKYMSGQFDVGTPQEFKEVLKDPEKRKKVYDYMSSQYDVGTQEEFDKKLAPPADHQLDHSAVSDLRFLQGQVNNNPEVQLPGGMAKQADIDPAFATKQKDLQDQADKKMLDVASDFNADPRDVQKVMQDFPYENDSAQLKGHLQMMKDNPAAYSRFVAGDQNMKMIGAVNVHAANEYNHLQDSHSMDDLTANIAVQKNIINATLEGDKRDQALKNLEISRAPNFNSTNPELRQELSMNPELGKELDADQYAGLKTLQQFDPVKYDLYSRLLKSSDVSNAATTDPDAHIGAEKVKKDLLDIGRRNKLNYLQEQQGVLDEKWKAAQTDQDKEGLAQQFIANKNEIKNTISGVAADDARFPYMKDLEFENKAKELRGTADEGVIGYALSKFGSGIRKGIGSLVDAEVNLFYPQSYVNDYDLVKLGESVSDKNKNFLPESDRDPSVISYKFDPALQDAAEKIKKDKTISDDERNQQLISLVKANPDKVHTITNYDNYGKSANFFSKATLYKSSGMIGDLASIAITQAGMEGTGIPKLIAAAAPMYFNTEHDFYKEALEKGINNPSEYAGVHSAIMMAAGMINPDINIVKRSLGLESELGKTLAGVSEKTWNQVLSQNRPVLNKIKNSITGAAKEGGKIAAVYGAGTSIANDLANRGLFNDKVSNAEIGQHALRGVRDLLISSAPLLGLHAIMNFKNVSPEEKARLWDVGDNQKISLEKIDHLVKTGEITSSVGDQRSQFVKNIGKLIQRVPTEDVKGNKLTDQQRANFLYNIIMKDKIGQMKGDLPESQAEKLDGISKGIDIANGAVLDPKAVQKSVATGLANVKIPEGSPLSAMEGNGPALIKFIQEQVTGHHLGTEEVGPPAKLPQGMFPEHLVEAAVRLLPDETKNHIREMHDVEGYGSDKLNEWLHVPKVEEPSKTAPTVVMPGENKSPQVVPLKETPPERIVKTTSVAGEEPTLPKGETPVTLSGMTESERQEAITQRRSKTELPDEVKWENGIHDTLGKMDKMKPSERRDAADQIRQEVRKKNSELGFEKYKYSTGILSRRVAVRSGFRKGQQIWRRSRPKFLETGNQSIVDKGTVLRDRSPELQHHFEELSDVAEHLDIPDASNNKMLSKEQINSAIQDIHDGIPSVQAESVLNVLEKGVREDAFPVKEAPGGSLNMNELTGAEKEVTGEPFDKGNLIKWLNDESTLTPEHEEVLHDNIENLLHDYSTEDIPESQISGADALAKKGADTKVKPGAGDETKIAKPGETKAAVAKLEIEREASIRNPKPKADLPFISVDDIVSKSNSPEEMKQKQDAIKDKQNELRKILDCLYN